MRTKRITTKAATSASPKRPTKAPTPSPAPHTPPPKPPVAPAAAKATPPVKRGTKPPTQSPIIITPPAPPKGGSPTPTAGNAPSAPWWRRWAVVLALLILGGVAVIFYLLTGRSQIEDYAHDDFSRPAEPQLSIGLAADQGVSSAGQPAPAAGRQTPPAPALGPGGSEANPTGVTSDLYATTSSPPPAIQAPASRQPIVALANPTPTDASRVTRVTLLPDTSSADGRRGMAIVVTFVSPPPAGSQGQLLVHFRDAAGSPLPGRPPYADADGNLLTWTDYSPPAGQAAPISKPLFIPYDQLPPDRSVRGEVALYDPAAARFLTVPVSFTLEPLR